MKNKACKLMLSAFLVMGLFFGVDSKVQAAPLLSGASSVIASFFDEQQCADIMKTKTNTTAEGQTTEVTATEQTTDSAIETTTEEATAEENIEGTTTEGTTTEQEAEPICGYTQIGIANVEANLNIRISPDETSDLVGKLPKNAACEVLGTEGEWSQIQSGEVSGYVKSEYLITGEEARTLATSLMSTVATVTAETLYVREQPNTECEVLAMMPLGEELDVTENLGDWIKIDLDGEEGYVSAEYVSLASELKKAMTMTEVKYGEGVSDVRVSVVSYATQYVGNPYVWGGTSLTNGADCSGFVLSVMANFGISLPHSSGAQSNCGTRVSADELKPGDLVFYGSGRGINHVAIYIGNGQIVHASSPKTGIKISNMYYRSPVCFTRVISD